MVDSWVYGDKIRDDTTGSLTVRYGKSPSLMCKSSIFSSISDPVSIAI